MKENEQRCRRRGSSTERFLDKEAILRELDIQPGQVVLDVGCGDGYMAREFSRAAGDAGKVYALERHEDVIEQLRAELKGTNVTPVKGDITEDTGIDAASVDLIYLSTVFHIFNDEQVDAFRREVGRVLKPGGKLAIIEIDKRETPMGPPQDMRSSPEELQEKIRMTPLSVVRAGEYFYMQTFRNGDA
ncbi:MAG: class I SAM-dependent methyltransferase [Candidatus Zixiibacteriota bacterium]|jgi:ubiquinone/menaquinone biosynthesis C-methylase UbiE